MWVCVHCVYSMHAEMYNNSKKLQMLYFADTFLLFVEFIWRFGVVRFWIVSNAERFRWMYENIPLNFYVCWYVHLYVSRYYFNFKRVKGAE